MRTFALAWVFSILAVGCGGSEETGGSTEGTQGAGGDAVTSATSTVATGGLCVPGAQVECACPGGDKGAQACKADGSGYDTCDCSAATGSPTGTGGDPTTGAGANASTGAGGGSAGGGGSTGGTGGVSAGGGGATGGTGGGITGGTGGTSSGSGGTGGDPSGGTGGTSSGSAATGGAPGSGGAGTGASGGAASTGGGGDASGSGGTSTSSSAGGASGSTGGSGGAPSTSSTGSGGAPTGSGGAGPASSSSSATTGTGGAGGGVIGSCNNGLFSVQDLRLYSNLQDAAATTTPLLGAAPNASFSTTPANDFVPGALGNGLRIDANDEYARWAQVAYVASEGQNVNNITFGQGSIDFCYLPSYAYEDDLDHALFSSTATANEAGLRIYKGGDGGANKFHVRFHDGVNVMASVAIPSTNYGWSANEWVRVTVTWLSTAGAGVRNLRVYFDAVEVEPEVDSTGGFTAIATDDTKFLTFGSFYPDTSFGNAEGIIDEPRIYGQPGIPTQ